MNACWKRIGVAPIACLVASASATTLKYHIVDLDTYTLDADSSTATGLNENADVIGSVTTGSGSSATTKAYVWTKRTRFSDPAVRCIALNPVGSDTGATALAINSSGTIVGKSGNRAAQWSIGSSTGTAIGETDLTLQINGLSDAGQILASWQGTWAVVQGGLATPLGADPDLVGFSPRYEGSGMNRAGNIVGNANYTKDLVFHIDPEYWLSVTGAVRFPVPSAWPDVPNGRFEALNDSSIAVGLLSDGATFGNDGFACDLSSAQFYRWKTTEFTFAPNDINDAGLMVGSGNAGVATMVYTSATSRTYLHQHFEPTAGWYRFGSGSTCHINNFGMISGSGWRVNGTSVTHAFLAIPTYEPHASVTVPVVLSDVLGVAPTEVSWEIRQGNVTITSGTQSLDSSGNLVLNSTGADCPVRGDVTLVVKASHWLSKKLAFNVAVDSTSWSTSTALTLANGDIDGDDAVTVFDYNALSAAFDTEPQDPNWNAEADLDCDGAVTVFDYNILTSNFDAVGEF